MHADLIELNAPPGSPAWRQLVTASKVPGIMGATHRSSPTKEFHIMRGELDPDPPNEAMQWGHDLEPVILRRFFRAHPDLAEIMPGCWTRPGLEWLAATPDAVAEHRETGERFVVEAKLDMRGNPEYGETHADDIPLTHYMQVQVQLYLLGIQRGWLARFGPFFDESHHLVELDVEFAEQLVRDLNTWWQNTMAGIEPPVDGLPETYHAIRRAHPEIDRDQDWPVAIDLAQRFTRAVAAAEAAETELNEAKSTMLRAMGRARRAVVPGTPPGPRGGKPQPQVVATRQPTGRGVALYGPRKPIDWDLAASGAQ